MADGAIPGPGQAADRPRRGVAAGWPGPLLLLGAGMVLLGVVFAEEGLAAMQVWNSNAAYNHCWLILPIAAWLGWMRRDRLAGLRPVAMPLAALLMLPAALAWLVAERLGIMEGRQVAAMGMIWVLVLAVLGPQVFRAMLAPLAYLIFLVPFGDFATPALQDATAGMIELGLTALGITHYRDGLLIETTAGLFHVAEACAGLRFLIAALAFGALYALVLFRSPGRRLLVLALALVVPVVANGIRALGIVVLADHLGSAEAAAADHVVYGWGFFSAIILLLVLAGLPFREDGAPPRAIARPAPSPGGVPGIAAFAGVAGLALVLAGAGPATVWALDATVPPPREVPASFAVPEGCEAAAEGQALRCAGDAAVTGRIFVFSPRVTWRAVSAARWRLGGGSDDTDMTFTPATPSGGAAWSARQSGAELVAVATWLDGRPAGNGLRSRLAQAVNSLRGQGGAPVLVAMELRVEGAAHALRDRTLLEQVLAAQEGQDGLAARAALLSRRSVTSTPSGTLTDQAGGSPGRI